MNQYPTKHEHAEAFDRQACIRATMAEEMRVSMLTLGLGQNIEERYIADETVSGETPMATHLTSMETAAEGVRQRALASGDIAPEDAAKYSDEAYWASRRAFGEQTIGLAHENALARTLTPTETASLITYDRPQDPTELGVHLVESAKQGYADCNDGWGIFPTADGPMLAVLTKTPEGADAFSVAHLDRIFETAPDRLKQLIREHHEVEAGNAVVGFALHRRDIMKLPQGRSFLNL